MLQSVQLPENTTASVSVIDHSVLRITDVLGTKEPFTFQIHDVQRRKSATGSVSVVPVPAPAVVEAPQPKPDEVNVRVNDVVTIPVLANDTHPQGEKLTVDPVLPQAVAEADGKSFVSENTLRFIAGPQPKTVRAIYNAVDPQGQKSAAAVTIHILPLEGAENSRPQPKNLTASVVAAGSVRIPVELDGIDPDGDSVQLTGIDSTPPWAPPRSAATSSTSPPPATARARTPSATRWWTARAPSIPAPSPWASRRAASEPETHTR